MKRIIVLLLFLSLFAMTVQAGRGLCNDCTVSWEPIKGSIHKASRSSLQVSSGVGNFLTSTNWWAIKRLWVEVPETAKTPEMKAKYENLSKGFTVRAFGPYVKFRRELEPLTGYEKPVGRVFDVRTMQWVE